MSQQQHVGSVHTTVRKHDGALSVVYHSTEIVRAYNDGRIVLDSGGWRTATTKTRMNQAANQYDLGFQVWQRNGSWYVGYQGAEVPFVDGMTIGGRHEEER